MVDTTLNVFKYRSMIFFQLNHNTLLFVKLLNNIVNSFVIPHFHIIIHGYSFLLFFFFSLRVFYKNAKWLPDAILKLQLTKMSTYIRL